MWLARCGAVVAKRTYCKVRKKNSIGDVFIDKVTLDIHTLKTVYIKYRTQQSTVLMYRKVSAVLLRYNPTLQSTPSTHHDSDSRQSRHRPEGPYNHTAMTVRRANRNRRGVHPRWHTQPYCAGRYATHNTSSLGLHRLKCGASKRRRNGGGACWLPSARRVDRVGLA